MWLRVTLSVLVVCICSNGIASQMKCPEGICTCESDNGTQYISQCTNGSLTDIPPGLDLQTTVLNVSNNNITHLGNSSSEDEVIVHVDKGFYKADHSEGYDGGVLKSLNSLSELHLESNMLASIAPGTLDGNPNLVVLNLRNNNLTSLPIDVITLKNKIQELDISDNVIQTIDLSTVKKYYPSIRRLDIKRNKLTHLTSTSPIDNSTLEIFDASLNYIVYLNKAFANATGLKEVNVSNNEIREIDPNEFSDSPDLAKVDMSRNHLLAIHKDAFSYNSKITEVHAGSNKMTFLHPDTFSKNPLLTKLTISWNDIQEIHPATFINNPNLESIDFNTNKIQKLDPSVFQNNPKLRSVDLRSNSLLTVYGNTFHNNPQLEHLLLSKNEHVRFHNGFLLHATTLKVFDAQNCNLTELPAGILNNASGLQELNLASNNLTSLDNITDHGNYSDTLTKLEVLDLSNNRIQRINVEVFTNKMTNLKELRIAGNEFLCDCNLRSLWLWSQRVGIIPMEPQITCRTAKEVVPWENVQNLNCTDDELIRQMGAPEGNDTVTNWEDYPQGISVHDESGHISEIIPDRKDSEHSDKILVGVSLFILLAVVLVILPLLFIMRRRYGTYKVTKPKNTGNGNTDTNPVNSAPSV